MLTAMIDGQANPLVLAELAKGTMRRTIPDLAQALEGHFDAHHARLARSILARIDQVQAALVELDEVISIEADPWQHQLDLLQTMPGIGPRVAHVILAETGADMTRFGCAARLAGPWVRRSSSELLESCGRSSGAGQQSRAR